MEVDFEREKKWWSAKAPKEEDDRADEAINRALRWRAIERHLAGVETILDIGGGTGAFSIPLARRGFSVTHLDISPAMLELARGKAEGLDNIRFVAGNSVDLSLFPDQSFDLVLNMDGAISFCGSEAVRAVLESCRVTAKVLILSATNLARMIPIWLQTSIQVSGRILPAVYSMVERGEWHQDEFPDNAQLSAGCTQGYFGAFRAFACSEIRQLLTSAGLKVVRVGGLGSLASMCGADALRKVQEDDMLYDEFLDLCERYDNEVLPEGSGTSQRAGLLAVALRPTR